MGYQNQNIIAPVTGNHILDDFLALLAYKFNQGVLLPSFSSDPSTTEYRLYFNTTLNHPRYYNGTAWVTI